MRRRTIVGLVVATFATFAAPGPAWASSPESLTWTGATFTGVETLTPPENWSLTTNWKPEASVGKAPMTNEEVGTLTFPDLSSNSACTEEPPIDTCYTSHNDLKGLTVRKLVIDGGAPYVISGEQITLGAEGMEATPAVPPFPAEGMPRVTLPMALGAAQTWSLKGGEEGGGSLLLGGAVTGESHNLEIALQAPARLTLMNNVEVGETTIKGTGFLILSTIPEVPEPGPGAGWLNAADGNRVNVEGAGIAGVGSLGPLTLTGGRIQVGNGSAEPGVIHIHGGLTFEGESFATFTIAKAGATAAEDYGQLNATGNVELGGAQLTILPGYERSGSEPPKVICPKLKEGEVDTIVSTTAMLTGTFAGVPDGAVVETARGGPEGCTQARLRINYTEHAVTATVLQAPPVNTSPPTISGTAQEGHTLAEAHGGWENSPTEYAYRWLRCDSAGGSCASISGTSSQAYTLGAEDVGHTIRVRETARNATGSASAESVATGVVAAATTTSSLSTTIGSSTQTTSGHGTAVATGVATVKRGVAFLRLSCTGQVACEGSLKLVYEKKAKKVVKRHGKRHVRHVVENVTIGEAHFSIEANGHETLKVKLTGEGLGLVAKGGKGGLKVKLSGSGITSRTIVLKSAKKGKARRSNRRERR